MQKREKLFPLNNALKSIALKNTPKLFRVILPVHNIEAAAKFYAGLLGLKGTRVSGGRHYFDCGGTLLACYDARADGDTQSFRSNPEHVYFSVDALEEVFERAKQLPVHALDPAIETRPWGERSFYGTDPFGNRLCFVEADTAFTG